MRKKISKFKGQAFTPTVFTLLIAFFLVNMIANPNKFIQQSLDGISAWAFAVLPSVLPFMFFTKALSSLDILPKLTAPLGHISQKLFKTPSISIYAFFMAILSGYPVGAKLVADLYLQGKITKEDAFKMTSFCSTSGPMFIIGAVGVRMFGDVKLGYILFISHALGAVLNGILFRKFKLKENDIKKLQPITNPQTVKKQFDLSEIVLNSTLSILSVGCIIAIFFIIIECFSPVSSLLPENFVGLFEGIIEITKGCLSLSTAPNRFLATILCSFVISFGGISTILQSLTMLSKVNMPVKLLVFQKLCHGMLSALITLILLLI